MARPLRIEYDGALHHVMARGNAREPIYLLDEDRQAFVDQLWRVDERFGWVVWSYCLLDNHYHLLIETPDGAMSRGMRELNGVYTEWIGVRSCMSGLGSGLALTYAPPRPSVAAWPGRCGSSTRVRCIM